MDPLLEELMGRGVLDAAAADWTRAYIRGRGGTVDTAVLELDLVDESDLLAALASVHRLTPASPGQLFDSRFARRLPSEIRNACPLPSNEDLLQVMVSEPLNAEALALLGGQPVEQLVAPFHHIQWARSVVYGESVEERAKALQSRLERRRRAESVTEVLESLSTVSSMALATTHVLEFAANFLEFACLLMSVGEEVRVVASRNPAVSPRTKVAAPGANCSFAPAVRFGGYFVGGVTGTDADARFFDALGRAQPRWAFVAPVPIVPGRSVVLFGDNGQRGMATRSMAKLTLVASRLGQQAGRLGIAPSGPATSTEAPVQPPPAIEVVPEQVAVPEGLHLTAGEVRAMRLLRHQADLEGLSVQRLVEALLRDRSVQPAAPEANVLLGEVKELFEQLAASLPTQLAQGIESAMRDITHAPAVLPAVLPAATPEWEDPKLQATPIAEIVAVAPMKREVASYRSQRKKSSRVKL